MKKLMTCRGIKVTLILALLLAGVSWFYGFPKSSETIGSKPVPTDAAPVDASSSTPVVALDRKGEISICQQHNDFAKSKAPDPLFDAKTPLVVHLPPPANGRKYSGPELKRHFPQLMADVARLKDHLPVSQDGIPDFHALATRKVEELTSLARQLSQMSRAQFRALIQERMRNFTFLERIGGGPEIAQKLLAALDSADQQSQRTHKAHS